MTESATVNVGKSRSRRTFIKAVAAGLVAAGVGPVVGAGEAAAYYECERVKCLAEGVLRVNGEVWGIVLGFC